MGFALRIAVAGDEQSVCELLRRAIAEGCAPDHRDQPDVLEHWLANKTPQTVRGWMASPSNYMLVADSGVQLLGVALLNQAGKLALCYVDPDMLKRGVGRAMLEAVEVQARSWNISKLFLHSPASASGFFARLGYADGGKEKACYGLECDLYWKPLNGKPGACAADPSGRARFCQCAPE
ncbi:MAG: GNAT family N-acetyltransferase [Pseudomonadota bacterium]|nr:GNAT family N-acetyltransferase [Pseudomonadota bacterium]